MKIYKLYKNIFISLLVISTILVQIPVYVFSNIDTINATVVQDDDAGTYTDNFSDSTGLSSKSNADVNATTTVLQLTNSGGAFVAPYNASGTAITDTIIPELIGKLTSISIVASTTASTTIKIQFLDQSNNIYPDSVLSGNEAGFSSTTVNLSSFPILYNFDHNPSNPNKVPRFRIKFILETSDADYTPSIDSLTLNWDLRNGTSFTSSSILDSNYPITEGTMAGTRLSQYNTSNIYPAVKWVQEMGHLGGGINLVNISHEFINVDDDGSIYVYSPPGSNSTSTFPLWYSQSGGNMETGKLFKMNSTSGNVLWSNDYDIWPQGMTSSQDTIYFIDYSDDILSAHSLYDGSIKWVRNMTSGHSAWDTLINDDGSIIYTYASNYAYVRALNPNGSIKWTSSLPLSHSGGNVFDDTFMNLIKNDNKIFVSVCDGTTYCASDGKVFALDTTDGNVDWQYNIEAGYSTSVVTDGNLVYVGNRTSTTSRIDALNVSDGTLEWSYGLGDSTVRPTYMLLKNNGELVVESYRYPADHDSTWRIYSNHKLTSINSSDGSLVWSKDTNSDTGAIFANKMGGIYLAEDYLPDNLNHGVYSPRISYMSTSGSEKWRLDLGTVTRGTDTEYPHFGSEGGLVQGINGWVYGGLNIGTDLDGNGDSWFEKQDEKIFAIAPWTISTSPINSVVNFGDSISFSVTTAMKATNPLTNNPNYVQIILDNGDKISLSNSSTNSNGDTIWTGSYLIPDSMNSGPHTYTAEASQANIVTDITTHFISSATLTNNTGITTSGEFIIQNSGSLLPPEAYASPLPSTSNPTGTFTIDINNNSQTTTSPNVTLTLDGGPDAVNMAISNTSDFKNAIQQPYKTTKQWTLTSGNGVKTVYVKFYTQYGQSSDPVSDNITLTGQTGNQVSTSTSTSTSSQSLLESLLAQVANLQAQLKAMTGEANSNPQYTQNIFTYNFHKGKQGEIVKQLQQFLNNNSFKLAEQGPGSPGNETTYFGKLTENAVQRFQLQYNIVQNENDPGYGYVGPKTRAKLNELL